MNMNRRWESETETGNLWSWKLELRDWVISAIVALPFLSLYAAHFLWRRDSTGFLDYDMAFYVAIGRSIFSHGNGILYPNPYDVHGPMIYFQWFPWLLGLGTAVLHLDPGYLFAMLGVLFAVGLCRITLALIRSRINTEGQWATLMLAFWGGGLLVFGGIIRSLLIHQAVHRGIFYYDIGDGLWFLNWGRNSIFTTEALYHILAGGLWLCVLRKRWGWAITMLLLITTTHPWTGAEMLGIVVAYLVWLFVRRSSALPPMWFILAVLTIAAGFGWYYGMYLPGFAQHKAIVTVWALTNVFNKLGFILSLLPVISLVIYRAVKRPHFIDGDDFLMICFLVSALLSIHDLFMPPVMPVHFDRGYPWMALFLLGLPALPNLIERFTRQKKWVPRIAVAAILLLVISDNAAFLQWRWRFEIDRRSDLNLTPSERKLFSWLDAKDARGVFFAQSRPLSYLSSAYTNVSPYLGHTDNTPDLNKRIDTMERFYSGDTGATIPADVNLILLHTGDKHFPLPSNEWILVYEEKDIHVFSRKKLGG